MCDVRELSGSLAHLKPLATLIRLTLDRADAGEVVRTGPLPDLLGGEQFLPRQPTQAVRIFP